MKKKYLILSALLSLSSFSLWAQKDTSVFKKKIIDKTEIETLYSNYAQDGHNSAVTGGKGTEKLAVYAPRIKITRKKNDDTYMLKFGVDIISSASTDNIDFVMSSASLRDMRSYANVGYSRNFEKQRITVNAGTGFSIESDYTSIPLMCGISYTEKNKMRDYYFNFLANLDDLRWGRLNTNYLRGVKLIYPVELRYKVWYDDYLRQSYNFKFGMTQVLNKRNILGIYPELTYQAGLLATPFHRVYFKDFSERVENLPDHRIKALLGLKLNSFVGNRVILRNRTDLYSDDWGIMGIALENETAVKLNPQLTLSPSIRVDFQKGARYFAPFSQHELDEKFYTSDYDLSTMRTYQAGIGIRYAILKSLTKRMLFDEVRLRYAFYYRSNQLHANLISCAFNISNFNKGKPKPKP